MSLTSLVFRLFWCPVLLEVGLSQPLFTQQGKDPSFEEVMQSGKLPKGETSRIGVTGSKIRVARALVEATPSSQHPIEERIMIHTLGNSVIRRVDFPKWSRWYQEDGRTQVFRLFKNEENVRNSRGKAARIEAFSQVSWTRGEWHEWSGSFTLVKPHSAAVFQVKNNVNDWAVQLNVNDMGDVVLNHRRGKDQVIAKGMIGKPFDVKFRDNGHDYEFYMNGKRIGAGSFDRPKGETCFRWGMYLGNSEVRHDAMIFVSGATVNSKPLQ